MRTTSRLAAVLAATLLGTIPLAAARAGGTLGVVGNASRTWGTNGRVSAILSLGTTAIIGGDFTSVVDPSGRTYPATRLARYDTETGAFDTSWTPSANGPVLALATAGDSLYIGGQFTMVNDVPHTALGAVSLSSGAFLPQFTTKTNKEVTTLAVSGSSLFVGGSFKQVHDGSGRKVRSYGIKVDRTTGTIDPGWAPVFDKRVRTMLVNAAGTGVYVGGDFTTTNALSFAGKLTLLSTSDATIDPVFRSGPTNNDSRSPAYAMTLSGSSLLVAATGSGGGCARLDATTGATSWSKHSNGDVQSIAVMGPYTYCGGHFSGGASFDKLDRYKLAAVETATGITQPFAPLVNSSLGLWSMASSPTTLLVGGDFSRIDGSITPYFSQFRDAANLTTAPAPAAVSAQSGDAAVSLTWDIPSTDGGYGTHSYVVYRRTGLDDYSVVKTTGAESFVDTSVTNGTTYTYAVVTRNTAGDSAFSSTVDATPLPASTTAPGVPTGFQATSGLHVANLTWTAPGFDGGTPITGYRILRGTSSGTETPLVDVSPTTLSYADSDIVDGTQYYYTLQALNVVGPSASTPEKTATPSSGVPSQPLLVRDTTTDPAVVTLNWTVADPGGSSITKYVVVRDSIRVGTTSGTVTTITDPAPPPGIHTYQVKAINGTGSSRFSNGVVVTIP